MARRKISPIAVAAALILTTCSCSDSNTNDYGYGYTSGDVINFQDDAETNTEVVEDLTTLELTDSEGNRVKVSDFTGQKNLVLVIMRGYAGSICLYCSTQTARIIKRYDEIAAAGGDVVVVFPVSTAKETSKREDFLASAYEKVGTTELPPFPVLVDVELEAVDRLGIRAALSKPATYILDKQGQVRFAFVGETLTQRPSVDAILAQLKTIGG